MGQLVLLRHGQSTWNLDNVFTGWQDPDITEQGVTEAIAGGEAMKDAGVLVDVAFTSLLRRAITTANLALEANDRLWMPVWRHWRLNERHYGALQGLNKKETAEKHGAEQVHIWRRSYDVAPPPVDRDGPHHPANDPRYADVAPELLPATECLKDVLERVLPYWYDAIVPETPRRQDGARSPRTATSCGRWPSTCSRSATRTSSNSKSPPGTRGSSSSTTTTR